MATALTEGARLTGTVGNALQAAAEHGCDAGPRHGRRDVLLSPTCGSAAAASPPPCWRGAWRPATG